MSNLTERLDRVESEKKNSGVLPTTSPKNKYASGTLTSRLDQIEANKNRAGSKVVDPVLSGLSQLGINVDGNVLQRVKDNYSKSFKDDYDLDYDMDRIANGLLPKSYDKRYDADSQFDRFAYENLLPNSKDFQELYNEAAAELNKEQEKLLKEQAPQRQYQSIYNEIGKDLTPYLDLETGELSEEKILNFVYGKFGEEGYADLADAWKQYKDDEDYDTHEEMLIAQAAQNDPDTYNIKRLMDELNEGWKKAQNEQAAELAEETGIGTTETSGLYGILPMAGSTEGSEKSSGTERPNIPILNSPALGGTGETTTMADIEEAEKRKAETVAQKAEWDLQDEELRAAIDTSGQRHLSGGLGATVEQIFNEDIQAQVDAYMAAADAEGKWTPFEVDQALRRANLDMYLHRDGKSFSDREVKNYAIATLQASGMTPEQAEAYFANMTDAELKTFEADMAFDTRVHADTSQEFGESLVSIPIRAVVNTWAGMVGLADMVAGVVDSDRDLWDYTKKMQEEAAKWQQYGHSERHESLNVISDVGSELLRMYALHLAGVGLASHAAGTGGLTAASLTTAQKGTGAILSTFAKGVRASAGSAPFVANAMGSYFTQAMQSGANRQQATGFAVFAGVMEGALESFGADAMFNKALSARMVKRMTLGAKGALTSPAAFKFVQVATSAIGNGLEEGASYILAGLGEMAFFNKNWRPDANELMDNVKMGFIVGSLGAMAGSASDSRAYAIYQQMLAEGYSPQLLDAGVFAAQVEAMPKAKVEARVQNAMELTQEEYAQAMFEHSKAVQDVQDITDQHAKQVTAANERVAAAQATLDNLIARKDALDPYNPKDAVALTQVCKEIASAKLTLQKTIESAEAAKQTAGKEFKSALANAQRRVDVTRRQLDDHAIAYDFRMQQMMARQDIERSIAELNEIEAQEVAIYERLANTTDISEIQALEQMLESFDERRTALKETIDEGIHTEEWLAMENKTTAEAWANDAEWQQTLQAYAEDRAARETAQRPLQSALNTAEMQPAILTQEEREQDWRNVEDISGRLGVRVVRADAETARQYGIVGKKNGAYINGTIYIREDSADPVMDVFKHELTHYIEASRFYGEFSKYISDMFVQQGYDLEGVLKRIQQEYLLEGIQLDRDGAMREFVADFVKSKLLTDEQSINTIVRMQKVPAKGIYNWIRATIGKLGRSNPASRQLMEAERLFRKAFSTVEGRTQQGAQYSIQTLPNGRSFVDVDTDQHLFDNASEADYPRIAKRVIQNKFRGTVIGEGEKKAYVSKKGEEEYIYPAKRLNTDIRSAKLRASAELDNIVMVSEFKGNEPDDGRHPEVTGGWDKYSTIFKVGGRYFEGEISIQNTERGRVFYDVSKIKDITNSFSGLLGNPSATSIGDTSGISMPDSGEGVNPEFTGQADIGLNFDDLLAEYGPIPQGENPVRDIQFPRQISDDLNVSRFARTAGESSALSDEQAQRLQQEVAEGLGTYTPFTDQKAMDFAKSTVANNGMTRSMAMWKAVVNGNKQATKADIALGEQLLAEAAAAGDTDTAMELIADLCVEATRAGQTVQAFSLLKKATPAGKLYYLERTVQKLNQDHAKEINGGKMLPVRISEGLKNDLLNAKTPEQAEAVENRIAEQIGVQIPATLTDKLNAWRYFSMLGNARTHLRNMFGNTFMMGLRSGKDAIGAGLERLVIKDQSQRTKSVTADKPLLDYAKSTWGEASNMMQGGKQGFEDAIQKNRRIFKTKALEWVTQKNTQLLEKEDILFSRRAYVSAFAKEMKAKGLNPETITAEQRSEIMNHAVLEAQKATFRDANAVASMLNKMENHNKLTKILVGGVVPFKKTPMNVLKRGIEYSPIGLAQGLIQLGTGVKSDKYTAAEAIDRISSGIVGSGLFGLGAFLASLGWLRASGEEDENYEYYLRDLGQQPYSIRIGDSTFTIDWVSPASIPLFMGAELYEAANSSGEGSSVDAIVNALSQTADPLTQLSMLQGLNDVLTSVQEGDIGGALGSIVTTSVQNYATQFIPTILGQAARTGDDTRRVNTGDPNSPWGASADYILRKTANKIPGVSMQMEPYVDKWGNEEVEDNWMVRLLENAILPGYVANTDMTDVDVELTRLYSETQNRDAIPTRPYRELTHKGESYTLTASEYTEYQKDVGEAVFKKVDAVMSSSLYRGKSDEAKAKSIANAISGAEEKVREEWKEKVGLK